jgi:hypothetical protein
MPDIEAALVELAGSRGSFSKFLRLLHFLRFVD